MADLRTDYKDDILDTAQNTRRKYNIINNDDGTVSFEDVTAYSQQGDTFGAADINSISEKLVASDSTVFRFGVSADGEYGYIVTGEDGADTVIPFSNAKKLYEALQYSGLVTEDMSFDEMCAVLAEMYPANFSFLMSGWTSSVSASGATVTGTCNESLVKAVINTSGGTQSGFYGYYDSPYEDLTTFSSLHIQGNSYVVNVHEEGDATDSTTTAANIRVLLMDRNNNIIATLFQHTNCNLNLPFDKAFDCSGLTGDHKLRIQLYAYHTVNPSWGHNNGSYVQFTKALLS